MNNEGRNKEEKGKRELVGKKRESSPRTKRRR